MVCRRNMSQYFRDAEVLSKTEREGRERISDQKRQRGFTCAGFVDNFILNVCTSVLAAAFVCGVYTHC